MKRFFAFLLTLLMVASLFPWGAVAHAETVGKEGFYMVNWSGSPDDFEDYQYTYEMPWLYTSKSWINKDTTELTVQAYGTRDLETLAEKMRDDFNSRPDGARYMNLNTLTDTFTACAVNVVDMTRGVALLKDWFEKFLTYYQSIGGKLDGVAVDLEYNLAYSFYIEDKQYGDAAKDSARNKQIYNQIAANAAYKTKIRPKLVERGFEFYTNPDPAKYPYRSEIWNMYRYSGDAHAKDRSIWDAVINEVLAEYINEAVLEPLLKRYPNATLSDYHRGDTDSWQKGVNDHGSVVGSSVKVGNTSNYNFYDFRPSTNFYKYATDKATGLKKRTVYMAPPSFNDAVYEDTPFGGALWDVNLHKRLLNATDTGLINTWIAFASYGDRYSMTPYYAEAILHAGLLDPKPFLGYIIRSEVEGKDGEFDHPDAGDYWANLQVVEDLMAELTRVAGATDRQALQAPINWNGSYMLTGMYAGGRNIWRITPDTTKVSVEDFKVKDTAPTFKVDGLTITFPQGRIIKDGKISMVGTCGYWVETPANVNPVVTSTADRYAENPAFAETFESYKLGAFTTSTPYPHSYWTVTGSATVQKNGSTQALALSGNTTVTNSAVPELITAGDAYAKQQAWEVTFTLPDGNYGDLTLLDCGTYDVGVKITGGKLYYNRSTEYAEMTGVTLSAGTYTVKREVDFRTANAYTGSYTLYDASGAVLKEVKDVPMYGFDLPVKTIKFSSANASVPVLIDNYKLYPTGATTIFELYDAKFGKKLTGTNVERTEDTAWRVSWMNASDQYKVARVYDAKTGTILKKIEMAPGMDGVETGTVTLTGGKVVQLALDVQDATAPTLPNYDNGNFGWTAQAAENIGLAVGEKPAGGDDGDVETPEDNGGATDGAGEEGDNIFDIIGNTPNSGDSGNADDSGNNNTTGDNANTTPGDTEKGLGGGVIALIAVGVLVVVLGGALAVFMFVVKPKLTETSPKWLLNLSKLTDFKK